MCGCIDADRMDVGKSRSRFDLLNRYIPVASGVTVERTELAGLPAEWLRTRRRFH